MAKYTVEFYGWEMEAMGFSLTNEMVEEIEAMMEDFQADELWEIRFEMEDLMDIWSPDLFHISKPFYNDTFWGKVLDEEGNVVLEIKYKDLGDAYENVGDVDEIYPYESYLAMPHYRDDGVENVMLIIDENKGGLFSYEFESDEIPTAKDFSLMGGTVDTPEGDWDFISRIFFKDQLLEEEDYMDNTGKASTMEIYTHDNRIIN